MVEPGDDIDQLIGKVLAGEASAEEQQRLNHWLLADEERRTYLSQMKRVYEAASSAAIQSHFDTDAAWQKVRARIHSKGKAVRLLTPMRIAASIAIVFSAAVLLYRSFNPDIQTLTVQAQSDIVRENLPDGSKAVLNRNTSITYEYNPRKKARTVKLTGEAFFDVKHNDASPMVIEVGQLRIVDIGTAFNVQAWPGKDTVLVSVTEGEVKLATETKDGLDLTPGETGAYSFSHDAFFMIPGADPNDEAYRTGDLVFNNAGLDAVVRRLNEYYDAKIELKNPELARCRITVSFHNDTLETVIDVIAETLHLQVEKDGKRILLDGKACE